jgi:hypothetical protein
VSHDGTYSRVSPRRNTVAAAGGHAIAPAAVEEPAPPLDDRGTRWAPRFQMSEGTEVQVDGSPATLVDLSATGAQVVAQAALKPNQRVRVMLADEAGVLRFDGAVAWASFEIPQGVTRYRAGISFKDAKPDAVEAFAARHKT